MAKWYKDGLAILPLFEMKCLGCKDKTAKFENVSKVMSNFPIDMDRQGYYNSYALDKVYQCNLCGWRQTFGIALPDKLYEEMRQYDRKQRQNTQMDSIGWQGRL